MTTNTESLLPCPFCGGRAEFNEHTPGCYFTKLDAVKKAHKGDVACMIDLIPAWNTRATQPEQIVAPSIHEQDAKAYKSILDEARAALGLSDGDSLVAAIERLATQPEQANGGERCSTCDGMGFMDGLGNACKVCKGWGCTHPAPAASAEREARVIEQNARKAAQEQLYAERERHTAEVKRLQAEIGRLKAPAASVSVSEALDRMDAILDPACGLLNVPYDSATVLAAMEDMRLIRALLALRPAQAADQWREAVEEQFAVNHIAMPEDPREAIKKLIAAEVRDALDPSISSAAAALAQAGVPDDIVKDAQRYRWLRKSLPAGQGSLTVTLDDRCNGCFNKPVFMDSLDAAIDAAIRARSKT